MFSKPKLLVCAGQRCHNIEVESTTNRFLHFERVDQCPACGSKHLTTATTHPHIEQCDTCNLLFRNPRPTQREIARSYNTGRTFQEWQEQETTRAFMWQRRAAILRRFKANGRLLDVGTGDGRFLRTCRDLGYEVVGTDISEAGASYARSHGFDVRMGQIIELDFPKKSFDIVTIWHVLEHVPDPGAVLRKVYSLLRPGGLLAIAVPNEDNFFVRRRFGVVRANPFAPLSFGGEIHLSHFGPAPLRIAVESAGFNFVEFGVDDVYQERNLIMKTKLLLQQSLARLFHWHFAVAMYVICRRPGD